MFAAELRQELDEANFVSVTIDASNRKEVKIVPVVVRYFLPDVGVKVKLLEFKSLPGETAAILGEKLVSILEQNELKEKSLGCVQTIVTPTSEVWKEEDKIMFFSE